MRLLSVERLLRRGLDRLVPAPKTAPEPKPERVFWWWEQICNLSCNHCDIGNNTESYRLRAALDLEKKKRVIDKLAGWLGPGYSLSLIAGEPFLHREVFDVLAHASASGAVTSLTTNGTLIATKNRARQVVESGLSFMAVSVDSLDPEFHDQTRGKPGTFAQAMKAIEHVREAREALGRKNPVVYVNSIVMRGNHDELLRLSDWCKEQGIEGHTFQPIATTDFFQGREHQGDHWFQKSELWPDPKRTLALVDELEARRAAGYPIKNTESDFAAWRTYFRDPTELAKTASCEGELKTLLVTETGDVKMCPNTPEAFGSILDDDLDWMWSSPAAGRARAHVYECDSQCKILANNKEDFYLSSSTDENKSWFGRPDAFAFLETDRDNRVRLERVEAFLRRHAKGELLDVGCGDGRVSRRFAALGHRVSGLDAAEENVTAARAAGIDARLGDASLPLPYDAERFDVVYSGELIEHLFDTQAFVAELARVTRRGGTVIVTTPNLAHLPDRLRLLLGGTPAQTQPLHPFLKLHIRPFTAQTLQQALEEAGLRLEKLESTLVVWQRDRRDPDRVRLASRALARLFPTLGSFLIAYAKKP